MKKISLSFLRGKAKRAAIAVLSVLLLAVPVLGITVRSAGNEPVYTTKTLYEWKQVLDQKDLGKNYNDYVILVWKDSTGNKVYSYGSTITNDRVEGAYEGKKSLYVNITNGTSVNSTFITGSTEGLWKLKIDGTDGDNGDSYKGTFTVANGKKLYDNDNWLNKFTDGGTSFVLATAHDKSCTYAKHIDSGFTGGNGVALIHNRTGSSYDRYVRTNGANLTITEYDFGDWLDGDDEFYSCYGFLLYKLNARLNYSALDSFTVASGQVVQLKDSAFLKDGCTITVEEGGLLSVEGVFYNNGKINNYGTVVVGENSSLLSFDPLNADAGSISCYGSADGGEGTLIVQKGGRLVMPTEKSYLKMTKGSSLVNHGTIVIPGQMIVSGAYISCSADSYLFTQYKMTKNLGKMTTLKVKNGKLDEFGALAFPDLSNDFYGSTTLFHTAKDHFVVGSTVSDSGSAIFEYEP